MATKTVINTNMPSTRGILILIDDQDHTKQQQQQQQEEPEQQHSPYNINLQKQTLRSNEQKVENGKITIYQNITTTRTQMVPTPATAITRTVLTKLQPQPSKLVATTTKIDVDDVHKYMCHNDVDNNDANYYYANNENGNGAQQQRNSFNVQSGEFVNVEHKTGYSTIKQTITTTAVPTFPHLLLKVVSERGKTEYEKSDTQTSNEEMHETNANENGVGGKSQQLIEATGVAASKDGQCNSNSNSRKTNYNAHTNLLPTNEVQHHTQPTLNGQIQQHGMMIIQCNGNNEYQHYQQNEVVNDELSNNDERTTNKRHHHVGSTLVIRETTSTGTASNVDHDVVDEISSGRVTSVVASNGQNAFERICTNDQNGNKYHDQRHCREATSKIFDCTTDDQQQLESKDVNAYTNVNANVVNNNSPIAKIKTKTTTTPVIKTETDCASAVIKTAEEHKRSSHAISAIIKTENQNQNHLEVNEIQSQSNLLKNQTLLHVSKIQIKPQEVQAACEKKQVTVVTLNELQVENLKQQQIEDLKHTIPVHKFESKKSATSITSESANNLQTIYEKMVQNPITTNTVKTAMSPTATASAAIMASTTILNSGAVSVTGANNTNLTITNLNTKTTNGNGNSDIGGSAHINGNTNGSAHINGNTDGNTQSNGDNNGNAHSNGNTNGNAHANGNTNGHTKSNGNTNGHAANTLTSINTSVTELNVSSAHPSSSYLYYVMSSGQFSPCDTLDSGTGSDLESSGNTTPGAPTAQTKLQTTLEKLNAAAAAQTASSTPGQYGVTPRMELLLKSNKIRLNANSNTKKSQFDFANNSQKKFHNTTKNGDHTRIGSFTDSEESEASSLSCDSLHSTEFMRQSSASPSITPPKSSVKSNGVTGSRLKMLGSFLPDSLLRDIRDRKFPTNDFELKYGNGDGVVSSGGSPDVGSDADVDGDDDDDATSTTITNTLPDAMNEQEYMNVEHAKFLCERNTNNINANNNNKHNTSKRLSLPNKTFVLNAENGTFVDMKMDSMPRKYEADKYYNFHVKEHENFHSFDMGGGASFTASDLESLAEYDTKSLQDDAFAGYKDIRCGSATSTIRSSKGTVRGVKNRVRNGIATFLQLQQPNLKNFKEKDAGKVVLYTTSMGIIRDTYAKCANVKQILRTLLVKFEERDVFMSIEYQQEIKERMHSEAIKVPQLFVEGQHIGDADTVERLNESGELRQLLKPYKSIATTFTCQTCGGYRLLPCPSCNGSKKSVHRNHFTAEFVALKCMNCDEVGLVKCHNC